MQGEFYSFSEFPTSEHEIEVPIGALIAKVDWENNMFLSGLKQRIFLSKASKKSIDAFLNFQIRNTKAERSKFLENTRKIVAANSNEFRPHVKIADQILSWIESQEEQSASESLIEKKATLSEKKEDPEFEEIIRDQGKWKQVLEILKIKEMIKPDLTWVGLSERSSKTELIALVLFLEEKKIIKTLPKSKLGRIFSMKFNCKMNSRVYRATPKDDILLSIAQEFKTLNLQ
jgi:hypothetical protein